eukprot:25784_1
MYGEVTTDYPWLAVMGNHDWGNADDSAICAWGVSNPYIDNKTHIPYAANQLNKDKKGCNPHNYYMPDFGYYYTINELNFEMIFMEETATICPNDMGNQDYKYCTGGSSNEKTTGCNYLGKMKQATEDMMHKRANKSTATNFILNQHYPQQGERLRNAFNSHRSESDYVWSIYGHGHVQECNNWHGSICNMIKTGGGGGCCQGDNTLRGFYVIGFNENKIMTQPYKFDDNKISCKYPCG